MIALVLSADSDGHVALFAQMVVSEAEVPRIMWAVERPEARFRSLLAMSYSISAQTDPLDPLPRSCANLEGNLDSFVTEAALINDNAALLEACEHGMLTPFKNNCETRVRYGYRRVNELLDRKGWDININKVYRIYRELGMQLRNKTPKRRLKA